MKDKSETVILIVEDEGLIALHMMEFLEREGYQVLEPVSSGEEAVERCGDHRDWTDNDGCKSVQV